MVCTNDNSLTMLGSVFFIGFTVGSLFWLILADKIGRKPIIHYGLVGHAILVLLILLIPYAEVIYLFMALQGIQVATTSQVAYVLLLEMVPTNRRSLYCAMLNTLDGGLSSMLLPLFYYLVGDWRILFFFNLFVTVAVFIMLFFVTESPRYYLSLHLYDKARQTFSRIAAFNNRPEVSSPFEQEINPTNQTAGSGGLSLFCRR